MGNWRRESERERERSVCDGEDGGRKEETGNKLSGGCEMGFIASRRRDGLA